MCELIGCCVFSVILSLEVEFAIALFGVCDYNWTCSLASLVVSVFWCTSF